MRVSPFCVWPRFVQCASRGLTKQHMHPTKSVRLFAGDENDILREEVNMGSCQCGSFTAVCQKSTDGAYLAPNYDGKNWQGGHFFNGNFWFPYSGIDIKNVPGSSSSGIKPKTPTNNKAGPPNPALINPLYFLNQYCLSC